MFHKCGEGRCLNNREALSTQDRVEGIFENTEKQSVRERRKLSPVLLQLRTNRARARDFQRDVEGVGSVVRQKQQQNLTCISPEIFSGKRLNNVRVRFSSKQKLQINVRRTVLYIYIVGKGREEPA